MNLTFFQGGIFHLDHLNSSVFIVALQRLLCWKGELIDCSKRTELRVRSPLNEVFGFFFREANACHAVGAHVAIGELVAGFIFISSPSPVCLPLAVREGKGYGWVLSVHDNCLTCTLMILKCNKLQVKFWTL